MSRDFINVIFKIGKKYFLNVDKCVMMVKSFWFCWAIRGFYNVKNKLPAQPGGKKWNNTPAIFYRFCLSRISNQRTVDDKNRRARLAVIFVIIVVGRRCCQNSWKSRVRTIGRRQWNLVIRKKWVTGKRVNVSPWSGQGPMFLFNPILAKLQVNNRLS